MLRRRPASGQEGFAIVEIVVAAAIFLLIAGAALATLTDAQMSTAGSERHTAAVALAQREVERMRQVGWAQLAIAAAPTPAAPGPDANPINPNEYVSGSNLLVRSNFRNRSSAAPPGVAAGGEPLVVAAGGATAGPERVSAGGWLFDLYRYVSWVDLHCQVAGTDRCPGTQDGKRIVVAVRPVAAQGGMGISKPVWVTSLVTDPAALAPGATPPPAPAGSTSTAQPFFLYDSTCDKTARQDVVAGHAAHDTGQGLACGGATSPRPDLMGPDPALSGTTLYNYAQDFPVPRTGGAAAPGLALAPPDPAGTDCPIAYTSATEVHRVHRWASVRMPAAFTSTGRSAMTLWTKTVGELPGTATVCVALHRMNTSNQVVTAAGGACPNPAVCALATTTFPITAWPQAATQVSFTFAHSPFSLAVNQRLLLTLSLTRSSLAGGIELHYDHPTYDSELSVGTTTPLP